MAIRKNLTLKTIISKTVTYDNINNLRIRFANGQYKYLKRNNSSDFQEITDFMRESYRLDVNDILLNYDDDIDDDSIYLNKIPFVYIDV